MVVLFCLEENMKKNHGRGIQRAARRFMSFRNGEHRAACVVRRASGPSGYGSGVDTPETMRRFQTLYRATKGGDFYRPDIDGLFAEMTRESFRQWLIKLARAGYLVFGEQSFRGRKKKGKLLKWTEKSHRWINSRPWKGG